MFLSLFVVSAFAVLSVHGFSAVSGKKVAILQSKGGGHGEIGFALAKALLDSNEVTILQDPACKRTSQPFCEYDSEIIAKGVKVEDCDLSNADAVCGALPGEWDVVIDNNNKDASFAEKLASGVSTKQLFYVSSGGMYKECPEGGALEASTPVKDDNACRQVEVALQSSPIADKVTIFRPQYIYGDNTNKRSNVDWFVDRICRDMPVPMPGDGSQLIALSHVDDVAALMCAGIDKEAGIYNCGTDKFISYRQVCELVASTLGKTAKIESYDPKALDKELGKPSFPFRPTTFTVNPNKAKSALGWEGATHSLEADLPKWIEQYTEAGLDKKEIVEDAAVSAVI
jgi:nucleoside-diphosphate-sugar epimerase|tara:strand:- start:2599 stop:3624 length:1026 start_codon:yes stop_codon:yes gene_type:complete